MVKEDLAKSRRHGGQHFTLAVALPVFRASSPVSFRGTARGLFSEGIVYVEGCPKMVAVLVADLSMDLAVSYQCVKVPRGCHVHFFSVLFALRGFAGLFCIHDSRSPLPSPPYFHPCQPRPHPHPGHLKFPCCHGYHQHHPPTRRNSRSQDTRSLVGIICRAQSGRKMVKV